MTRFLSVLLLLALLPTARSQEKPLVFDVWPGKAPGETGAVGEEKFLDQKPNEKPVKRLTNVTRPTISATSTATSATIRGGRPRTKRNPSRRPE